MSNARRRPAESDGHRMMVVSESTWRTFCRAFPPARRSASRFPAASTPAPRFTGCARRARFRTPTPPTSDSPTNPTTTRSRRRALQYGAEKARLIDCRAQLVAEGLAALQCGAFHISTAGVPYFNTTPIGRAVTGTMLVGRDEGRRRQHLGRRQHVQGQRHRAVLPLRPARQSEPARSTSRGSISSSSTSSAAARRCPSTCERAGLTYKMSAEKAYSTDSNILGATHEAKDLEFLNKGITIVEPIMGVAVLARGRRRSSPKTVTVTFDEGQPVALNGITLQGFRAADARGQPHRRPPRPRHERSDREPDHRSQEPRHLRGAGHGAAVHRLRAAGHRHPQRRHDRAVPRSAAAGSAACSIRAAGSIRSR